MEPFVANTDFEWFDFLAARAVEGRVDEVNFWSPAAQRPMKRMSPGDPVFLRRKHPDSAIAGYGFFAHFTIVSLDEAWRMFGWRNGTDAPGTFFRMIGAYRGTDLTTAREPQDPLACTVLRDVRFFPRAAWLPWGRDEGWGRGIQQGKTERDPRRVALLLSLIASDAIHREVEAELGDRFHLVEADSRRRRAAVIAVREGQGTFRARLLDAYERQCAVTGEHTEPVLDAAHIQLYLGPVSNHPQNGIVLTKEFHALFDLGYVGITPDYHVRISQAIRDRWSNGRRYYAYDGRPLAHVPRDARSRPSPEALEWHLRETFVA